jgi:hypothetical protein
MATKKRSRGRPKLSTSEKREREQRTKISFELNPYQLAILESWMNDREIIEGRSFSKAQACLHLCMTTLIKGMKKPEIDKVVQDWQKRPSKK